MKKLLFQYKVYTFLKNSIWVGPIITLFYLFKELTFFEIFLITSIFRISVAIFEVPTGALADKIGHKKSVILGALIFALSLALYPLGNSFIYFTVMELGIAVGCAFISGADDSLFYDNLKANNLEKEYIKFKGKVYQYSFFTQIVGAILSVYLYEINEALPFYVSGTLIFLSACTFATVKNIEIKEKEEEKISYINQIKQAGKYVFNHPKLKTIIIYSALINMFVATIHYTYVEYFLEIGIKEIYFGYIYAFYNLIALISSRYVDKIMKFIKAYALLFLGALLFISFIGASFTEVKIGILFIAFQQVYRGISKTIVNKYINKAAPSNKRATIQSYYNLTLTLFSGIFSLFLGLLLDYANIFQAYLCLSMMLLIILVISYFVLNKKLGKNNKLRT